MISDDDSFPPSKKEMSEVQRPRLHQVARGPELRVFKLGNDHLASVYYIYIYTHLHIHHHIIYIYIHIYIYTYIYIYIYTHTSILPYIHLSFFVHFTAMKNSGFGPWLCCPPRRVCHWRCGSRRSGWNSLLRGFQMMAPKWWLKATRQKKMRAHVISWGREIKDDKCETTTIEESSISTRLGCFQNFLQKHLNGLTQALCLRIGWRMMKVRLSGNPYIKNGKNPMETISK